MRILLAEDDPLLGDGLLAGLRLQGFQAAERELRSGVYGAAVLDLGLPRMDGMDVLQRFRATRATTPVLVLTARDTVDDVVLGLEGGADDYMVKPADLYEIGARLRALIRRAHGQTVDVLEAQGVVLDPLTRTVTHQGVPVDLTPREHDLLQAMLLNVGRVLSREQLENSVYCWGQEVESNAVEVHVHYLRKKLRPDLITTVRGVGYTIRADAGQPISA
jgi:two-component system OmpR family response regulator/two-component system response regulator QseB